MTWELRRVTAAARTTFGILWLEPRPLRSGGLNYAYRIGTSDVAVKEGGELRFGKRAHARRLDVAVLEEHQRRDAADAELGRRALVLVDVDLRDLQAPFVLSRHLVEDRRDRLAGAAPFRPVVDEHRRLGLEHFRIEGLIGDMPYIGTAHGSP